MNREKAYSIIELLANGTDPITGETFPETSLYNHPDVIRALFFVLRNQSTQKKIKKSLEEKKQENVLKGLPMNYGLPWTDDCIQFVIDQFKQNVPIHVIAKNIERKATSIVGLLQKKEIITEQEAFSLGARFKK